VPVPRRRRAVAPRGGHRGGDRLDGQLLKVLGGAELVLQPAEGPLVGASGGGRQARLGEERRGRHGEPLALLVGEGMTWPVRAGRLLQRLWQGMRRRGRLPHRGDSKVAEGIRRGDAAGNGPFPAAIDAVRRSAGDRVCAQSVPAGAGDDPGDGDGAGGQQSDCGQPAERGWRVGSAPPAAAGRGEAVGDGCVKVAIRGGAGSAVNG